MQKFDEISVLGTRFHKIKVNELIEYAVQAAKLKKKTIIGHVNTRAMNFAYELPWYKEFLNRSDLVFCDGFGVLLGAKLCGGCVDSSHRMTCPDYIEDFARACERENVSLFLLAGEPGTVDQAIAKLKVIAPNLRVNGHHGYFDKSGEENEFVIQQINQFKPDILYIGFGMPLQERWILSNSEKIETKVFLPLGACLDFYTGTVSRGPLWMTSSGLEWLTRLVTQPKRLWKRYVLGNPLFFYRVLQQQLMKIFRKRSRTSSQY
ncbi:MAG: WecB/TagA/CpsF family glycosyltransferase [Brasilonema angustatum HA4187-MV1]|jgi:N-acetylglucosaminyldiphosphoundecaprenol N-acetyl-beta-D-mannosaminyltransferase|nr:WecB/TagA/CpsF family glycosyltransferase [Brasilonema angustatum HA4187-MV1]